MQHTFQIDPQANLLIEEFSGVVGFDSLTKANAAIIGHPDFKTGLKFLTDLRNASIPFGFNEMYAHVKTLPPFHVVKHAFIVVKEMEHGMIRMFLALAEGKGLYKTADIFKTIEDGMQWLNS